MNIIIGQECICPDGLGRVKSFKKTAADNLTITVDTYINNRECAWSACNVMLIPVANLVESEPSDENVESPWDEIQKLFEEHKHMGVSNISQLRCVIEIYEGVNAALHDGYNNQKNKVRELEQKVCVITKALKAKNQPVPCAPHPNDIENARKEIEILAEKNKKEKAKLKKFISKLTEIPVASLADDSVEKIMEQFL